MITDDKDKKIKYLLDHAVSTIFPSREFLEKRLRSGEILKIYHGIDPTGPTLHLGHAVQLMKLAEFQELGHKVILLIGDFTAMIGDPTDKMSPRQPLTREEVIKNSELYKKQASFFLDFSGKNKAEIEYNSKWLSRMSLGDMFSLFSNMTYAQTIKRDMFQKRIAEGKDLFIHEFMYPALQGYDSVALDVDGEIGGNDQTFNMLMGRDLLKKIKNKEKFVLTTKLLTDSSGKKMGKTEGNMVTLKDDAQEMFGKIMSWSDELILPAFELCTKLDEREISEIKKAQTEGVNPKDLKTKLAHEITKIYHQEKEAKKAQENFEKTFSQKNPEVFLQIKEEKGALLSDTLLKNNFVKSKGEFQRLVEGGGVEDLEKREKIKDRFYKIEEDKKIKVGKKTFLKIVV